LVAVLGLVATGALVGLLAFTASRDAKAQAERAAEVIADQLRSTIALAEQTSNSLAAYVTGQAGDLRTVRTKEYMKALYSDSAFVKSLSLAPDNRIRYVVPVRGNETAVGLDLATVPEQWEPIKDIIDRGEPGLIGPIELVQGGQGFAYRVPIFLPFEGYWGLATTVIDADEFLSAATKVPGMDPSRVAVRDVSSGAKSGDLLWGEAAVLGEAPLVRSVRAADTDWEVAVTPAVFAEMDASLSRDGFWRGELVTRNSQGMASAHAATVTAVVGNDTAPGHRVAVLSALSSLREDLVTGLPGRQIFDDRLLHAIETSRLSGDAFALITLGIDHFRDVNESLGHRVGDVALREVADRLRQALPNGTTVARLGGDEFAVLLSDISGPEEVDAAALMLLSILRQPFELDQRALHLTASIGIAIFPADGDSSNDLLTAAEQAQRSAKSSGRNRHSFFTAEMQSRARERARLTEDLRTAIAKGQLHLEFQPIVRLRTDRISKAEALARWSHPELGVISPAVFIPLAESSGQILALSDWIFAQAVDFLVQARQIDADFTVSVNLSALDLEGPGDHASRRIAYMNESGVPSTAIIAEITESSLLHRDSQTLHNLARYRAVGIEFAIDDFGTGYSSLAYLQSLDVSYLKIDQSFTRGLTPGSENLALCAAIIDMGHALDLKVIAEGMETEVARALLTSAHCDFGQGYLFSRPVPGSQLLTQLRSLHPDPSAAQA